MRLYYYDNIVLSGKSVEELEREIEELLKTEEIDGSIPN